MHQLDSYTHLSFVRSFDHQLKLQQGLRICSSTVSCTAVCPHCRSINAEDLNTPHASNLCYSQSLRLVDLVLTFICSSAGTPMLLLVTLESHFLMFHSCGLILLQ